MKPPSTAAPGRSCSPATFAGSRPAVFRALLVRSPTAAALFSTATVSFVVTAGGGRGLAPPPAGAGNPERSRPPGSRLATSGPALQWDTPLIIIVLAGSCTLLLAAIIIATTCNRRKKEVRSGAPPGRAARGGGRRSLGPGSRRRPRGGAGPRPNMFDVLTFPGSGKAPLWQPRGRRPRPRSSAPRRKCRAGGRRCHLGKAPVTSRGSRLRAARTPR